MAAHVIEGTWEEIERHKAELIGRHLRVIVSPETLATRKPSAPAKKVTDSAQRRRVSAMGKYAGVLSSEDFMRQKQAAGAEIASLAAAGGAFDWLADEPDLYDDTCGEPM